MKLSKRIFILESLGKRLTSHIESDEFEETAIRIKNTNPWFTKDNTYLAIKNTIDAFLKLDVLRIFAQNYAISEDATDTTVGIVASGNIPAVGFHDLLCTFLAGHTVHYKASSQDTFLMNFIISMFYEIDAETKSKLILADRLNDVHAIIATGSNNTANYFEYYFGKKPNIIRKGRTSIAVLSGNENKIQLANLGNDIFQYFGLGCRNVSKLYVPEGYDFTPFFEAIEYWNTIGMHNKYNNNYDYNKSILLINGVPHLDNGFLLVREETSFHSALSVLHYETYTDVETVKKHIASKSEELQCVVAENVDVVGAVRFGESQSPQLNDFADGVDTMKFLCDLKINA